MTSWRDEVEPRVRDELDDLLDACLQRARQHLDDSGTVHPFGVRLVEVGPGEPEDGHADHEPEGGPPGPGTGAVEPAISPVEPEVSPGPGRVADVTEVFEACWDALRAEGDRLRAGAVVADVGSNEGDAVAVALEHRDGPAIEVFLPYVAQGKTNGKKPPQKYRFGDLVAVPGQRRLWT